MSGLSRLEAVLCAEVLAIQLADEHPDTDKLSFLRERAVELVTFIDEQLIAIDREQAA